PVAPRLVAVAPGTAKSSGASEVPNFRASAGSTTGGSLCPTSACCCNSPCCASEAAACVTCSPMVWAVSTATRPAAATSPAKSACRNPATVWLTCPSASRCPTSEAALPNAGRSRTSARNNATGAKLRRGAASLGSSTLRRASRTAPASASDRSRKRLFGSRKSCARGRSGWKGAKEKTTLGRRRNRTLAGVSASASASAGSPGAGGSAGAEQDPSVQNASASSAQQTTSTSAKSAYTARSPMPKTNVCVIRSGARAAGAKRSKGPSARSNRAKPSRPTNVRHILFKSSVSPSGAVPRLNRQAALRLRTPNRHSQAAGVPIADQTRATRSRCGFSSNSSPTVGALSTETVLQSHDAPVTRLVQQMALANARAPRQSSASARCRNSNSRPPSTAKTRQLSSARTSAPPQRTLSPNTVGNNGKHPPALNTTGRSPSVTTCPVATCSFAAGEFNGG
ncbi:hypothetical protein GNI_091470, partial [Gregarina niphandrodes]